MLIRLALPLVLSTLAAAAEEPPRAMPRLECLAADGVQKALSEGRIRRLADIGRRLDGDIVRAELCRGGDDLIYRVTLFDSLGRVRRVLLDARDGRPMYYDGR